MEAFFLILLCAFWFITNCQNTAKIDAQEELNKEEIEKEVFDSVRAFLNCHVQSKESHDLLQYFERLVKNDGYGKSTLTECLERLSSEDRQIFRNVLNI